MPSAHLASPLNSKDSQKIRKKSVKNFQTLHVFNYSTCTLDGGRNPNTEHIPAKIYLTNYNYYRVDIVQMFLYHWISKFSSWSKTISITWNATIWTNIIKGDKINEKTPKMLYNNIFLCIILINKQCKETTFELIKMMSEFYVRSRSLSNKWLNDY